MRNFKRHSRNSKKNFDLYNDFQLKKVTCKGFILMADLSVEDNIALGLIYFDCFPSYVFADRYMKASLSTKLGVFPSSIRYIIN